MAAVVWAADLLKKLADTGTPPHKVKVVRDAMAERWQATAKLKDFDPSRHVSADEAVGLLEKEFGSDHMIVVKAKKIRETGSYEAPKPAVHVADLIPEPPAMIDLAELDSGSAPDVVKFEAPSDLARAGEKKPRAPRAKKEKPAEDVPAVVVVASEIETVGPKPVEEAPQG